MDCEEFFSEKSDQFLYQDNFIKQMTSSIKYWTIEQLPIFYFGFGKSILKYAFKCVSTEGNISQ